MRCWGQVAVATVLGLVLAGSAAADPLGDARAAIDGSDYSTAQPALKKALESGTQGPAELAEIYKLTGIVEAALGNEKPAQAAFAKWLSLEPKGSLPGGTSPKITRPFTSAQAEIKKKGPLEAKSETADDPPAVTLVVANDPMKLIVGARVFFSVDHKPEQHLEADGKQRIKVELERGKRLDLRLQGVDEFGNRVVELGSKDVPIVITTNGQTTEPTKIDPHDTALVTTRKPAAPRGPRAWYAQWWAWGAVAVVATGTGAYFGWQTKQDIDEINHLNATSLDHPWGDAQSVESRARTHLLVTDIAAGTAGVFALGAVVLYLTRPDRSDEHAVAVVPVSGGGAIVLGGTF